MRALNVVIVIGSPSAVSKTAALAALIADSLGQLISAEVHQVDVYRLGPGFASALCRDELSAEALREVELAEQADVLIAATPVFRGSYSGMFKHFFDFTEVYALANKPVILAATGGSDRHALIIEHELRPLFGFFQAAVAPVGYFVNAGDFDGGTILNAEVYSRIQVGLTDILPQLQRLAEAPDSSTPHTAEAAL